MLEAMPLQSGSTATGCLRSESGALAGFSGRVAAHALGHRLLDRRSLQAQSRNGLLNDRHSPKRASAQRRAEATALTAGWDALQPRNAVQTDEDDGEEFRQRFKLPPVRIEKTQQEGSTTSGPPKINRDLLLYRARVARQNATRARHPKERAEQLATAESLLRRVLAMDPTDGRPYVILGRILVEGRRFYEARALYEEGARLTDNQNPFIWAAWAYMEAKLNNVKQARRLYDASTVADPSHAAAWHGWGLLEKQQGNVIRARDLWLKGIRRTKLKPNPFLYQSLAVLAGDMGLTEEARKWFRQGTSTLKGQKSHALWQSWALMEARQGDPDVVRRLFRKSLEVGPRSRYTYLSFGMWEKEQGRRNTARQLLEQGCRLNPTDPALLQGLAVLEEEDGNHAVAREYFERGTLVDPKHIHIWQGWGVMEFRLGNLVKARELFQQGVWADPDCKDVAYVWQAWGCLEKVAGNHDLARKLFQCAVKAMPQSEPSWQAWSQMEAALGNWAKADELRKYSFESQTEVVMPRSFADPDAMLNPILQQVSQWFERFEMATARSSRRPPPDWLAPDGSKLARPARAPKWSFSEVNNALLPDAMGDASQQRQQQTQQRQQIQQRPLRPRPPE